jgi:hypothetical protein
MVNNLSLSTLISQLPEAQRIHQAQLSHPETQHALAQELSQRRQEQEKKQVAKSEHIANQTVDKDGHQGSNASYPRSEKIKTILLCLIKIIYWMSLPDAYFFLDSCYLHCRGNAFTRAGSTFFHTLKKI